MVLIEVVVVVLDAEMEFPRVVSRPENSFCMAGIRVHSVTHR